MGNRLTIGCAAPETRTHRATVSTPGRAVHIAVMATSTLLTPASCTPYAAAPEIYPTEPPELDYRFFTPEFLDELEEHYQAIAVGSISA